MGVLLASVQAQQLAPYLTAADNAPLLAAASVAVLPAPDVMPEPMVPADTHRAEALRLVDDVRPGDLMQLGAPGRASEGGKELTLMQTRMRSRFDYEAWTEVNAGYGQFFPDDKIGRCRTGGAGLEEPDWVYVKLTFSF